MAENPLRVAAGNAGFDERIRQLADSVQNRFRYHSIELPDGGILPGLQSVEHLRRRLGLFDLPTVLSGKRVLDIGAWDGWFSFECERRGAEVVAVDCVELDTFLEAKQRLGSRVEYQILDVNELSARRLGHFDIVLFFGVLYHLRHPLLGLEKALELSTDLVLIESFVIDSEQRVIPAVMEFYERGELGGQVDNWCGPSPECLLAMCRSAGFAVAELLDITNRRASVRCRRHWPRISSSRLAPHLNSVVNNRTYTARFHPLKDEYLCCYFKSAEQDLAVDDVWIQVDGFGVPALSVSANGANAWQVNAVRPPALEPGRHRAELRIAGGAVSNPVEFLVVDETGADVADPVSDLPREAPELCSAEFQPSGDLRIAANSQGTLVCYFRSPAISIGVADLQIQANRIDLAADTISSLGDSVWQTNVLLKSALPQHAGIRLRLTGGEWTAERTLSFQY